MLFEVILLFYLMAFAIFSQFLFPWSFLMPKINISEKNVFLFGLSIFFEASAS